MLAKAEELGCEGTNIACLCLNEDFGNGIRDCTNEACGPNEDKKSVLSVGASFCAGKFKQFLDSYVAYILTISIDALAQISAGSIVTTATATALTIKTNTDASATGDATKTITKTGAPVSTASVLVATVTDTAGRNITSTIGGLVSGGVAITTTDSRGTTFVTTATAVPTGAAGGNGTTSGTASGTASLTGVRVTTTNSLGSTIVTTVSSSIGEDFQLFKSFS